MIPLPQWQGKTIGICGLGKTGNAALEALRASGATCYIWDDGATAPAECTPITDWPWQTLDAVLLSPGVPLTHPKPHPVVLLAKEHGVRLTSDIELLMQSCPNATFVGITGTNGKSTTTALTGHIITQAGKAVAVGGNLGTPALALAADAGIYVLELSSYQLDLLGQARFHIGALINLSPDHIDRHGDMEGYMQAKQKLFQAQEASDVAILGVDDAYSEAICRSMLREENQQVIPVTVSQQTSKGVMVKGGCIFDHGEQVADLANCLTLQGVHNHQNAAVAYAVCHALGIAHDAIQRGLETYPGLAHRMQRVAEMHGVLYVNDSKATNADAAAKSLATYEHIHWILGGVAKEGGIESLASYFPKIRHAYVIGQAAEAFAETLKGHVSVSHSDTLEKAVMQARGQAKAGEVVLLAPACASFDQFANFEQRGEVFTQLVLEAQTHAV